MSAPKNKYLGNTKLYGPKDIDQMLQYSEPTARQEEVIALYRRGFTWQEMSETLGISPRAARYSFNGWVSRVRRSGFDPEAERRGVASEGYFVKRKSVYTETADGGRKWVISEPEKDKQMARMLRAIEETAASLPKRKAIKSPPNKQIMTDLLNLYVITDYHLAMYAFGKETGADWNVAIATKTFMLAFQEMLSHSPNSEIGLFYQGGDFLHWDSIEAMTPTSGHVVDADTRADVMVEVALNMHIQAVEMMLEKHKKVHVIAAEGNHDIFGSIWIRKCLKVYFANNKRVTIDDTAFPYYAYQHGNIMLGFHHGHKRKNKDLPALFSSEPRYREMWGNSNYCYIHTGHYHQREQDVTEYGGAIVERHPTLAARDAYAARGGYVNWRAANAITYHVDKGEVARKVVYPPLEDMGWK